MALAERENARLVPFVHGGWDKAHKAFTKFMGQVAEAGHMGVMAEQFRKRARLLIALQLMRGNATLSLRGIAVQGGAGRGAVEQRVVAGGDGMVDGVAGLNDNIGSEDEREEDGSVGDSGSGGSGAGRGGGGRGDGVGGGAGGGDGGRR